MRFLVILAIALPQGLSAQVTGTVAGTVGDEQGPVPAATVSLLAADSLVARVQTDDLGRFALELILPGRYTLTATRIGLAPLTRPVTVRPGDTTTVQIALRASAVAIEGLAVTGQASRERRRFEEVAGVTVRELTGDEVSLIPGVGEADPIRAIEVLPGVISTSDFTSAFNVRGGSADQNLILLDGIPIFSPFHLGGVFSVFNPDLIGRAELESGGFTAEHGGRVSSVLLVESDVGDGDFGVDAGVSLLSTRIAVKGGLQQGRLRWRVSARRSYFDQLLKPAFDFPYHLADLQAVAEYRTGDRSRLRFSAYTGEDVLDLAEIDPEDFPLRINWDWGNELVGLSWLRDFDRGRLQLRASTTSFSTGLRFPDFDDTDFRSRIDQRSTGADLTLRASPSVELITGLSLDQMAYDNLATTGGTVFGEGTGDGMLAGAYAQIGWRRPGSWLVDLGLRVDRFSPDPGDPITKLSPRVAAKRFFDEGRWAAKVAAGRYTQFLHSLRDEELPIGLDIWVLSGRRAPHVVSDQIQVGVEGLPNAMWSWSAEAYYRSFDGVVTFNSGDDPNTDQDDILAGTGVSWGMDLFLRKKLGDYRGWISVGWLKADRTFPDFLSPEIPSPEVSYAPVFDKRLDVDVVLQFPAPMGWQGGLRLNVGTGTPYTRPNASYTYYQPRFINDRGRLVWSGSENDEDDGGGFAVLLGDRNGERFPLYHRLDLTFQRSWVKSWGTITPKLDILNIYNRKNPLFYFFEYDQMPAVRSGISMFPILPTFGVEVSF